MTPRQTLEFPDKVIVFQKNRCIIYLQRNVKPNGLVWAIVYYKDGTKKHVILNTYNCKIIKEDHKWFVLLEVH